jgi:hypothetical protein
MRNAVFWDIKDQFLPHRKHITSALQDPASYWHVRFEVFKRFAKKNGDFWDIRPCGSCKKRRFGGMCHYHHADKIGELRKTLVESSNLITLRHI